MAGGLTLEFEECFLNVAGHEHADSARSVVSLELHPKEAFVRPFGGDVIQGLKSGNKVFGMFAANIFDSNVIDNEA
jgi:hypothetical protein